MNSLRIPRCIRKRLGSFRETLHCIGSVCGNNTHGSPTRFKQQMIQIQTATRWEGTRSTHDAGFAGWCCRVFQHYKASKGTLGDHNPKKIIHFVNLWGQSKRKRMISKGNMSCCNQAENLSLITNA